MNKIIPAKDIIALYKKGYFPMADSKFVKDIKFYQPKKRFIIPINNFHVPKKVFKLFKNSEYNYKIDHNFEKVIRNCQKIRRIDNGTWINTVILDTYLNLHYHDICHSVECYKGSKLVGGLYGVHIGSCFFGESMFSILNNTSKFCLLYLIAILKKNLFTILDSQFYNKHLVQFGAYEISNNDYLKKLKTGADLESNFCSIDNFYEVLSLLQFNNHKS